MLFKKSIILCWGIFGSAFVFGIFRIGTMKVETLVHLTLELDFLICFRARRSEVLFQIEYCKADLDYLGTRVKLYCKEPTILLIHC